MDIDKFYINGEFITPDGDEKIDLINPSTEEIIGYVVSGSKKDVDAAVVSAKNSFEIASKLSVEARKKILSEIIEGMESRRQEFADAISEEMVRQKKYLMELSLVVEQYISEIL